MATAATERFLWLETPLRDNSMRLLAMEGREAMSELFEFQLEFNSLNTQITPKDLVGQQVAFGIRLPDDSFRHFHGFVRRLSADDEAEGQRTYRIEVVPWAWMLTCSSDCRIFQNVKVEQILREVFTTLEFTDFEFKLEGNHPEREYCVQYRETDFEFISRLMEEEGIFYYFRHEADRHTMVIADRPSAYFDCVEQEVDCPVNHGSVAFTDHIKSWQHSYEFRSQRWSQTDFDFENPDNNLLSSANSVLDSAHRRFERYDFPGRFIDRSRGRELADLRMEEEEARHDVVFGTSTCRSFTVGGKFRIRQHRCGAEAGKQFVITSVEHRAREDSPYEQRDEVVLDYVNRFTCIPHHVPTRPKSTTRRALVHGVQTAIVVGPAGEEIYTDKFGRVKVQFHWDRQGKRDASSSCWVRVSQSHASSGFGAIDIPRVGDEVIVSFLEGDPDRPIITGRVYHARNMPPYPLPAQKTITGIRSKTYLGDGYNELIVDDTPGNELVRIHAQRDMDTTVLNDQREKVKRDRTRTVGRNETVTIDEDRSLTIKMRDTQKVYLERDVWIGAGFNTTVLGEMNEFVAISRSEETLGFKMEYVGAFSNEEVRRSKRIQIGRDLTLNVGRNVSEHVKGMVTSTVDKDVVETFRADHHEVVEKEFKLVAKQIRLIGREEIVLQVGETVIRLTESMLQASAKDETEIGGEEINIASRSGDVSVMSPAQLKLEGDTFALKGTGDGKINAGMVKINC